MCQFTQLWIFIENASFPKPFSTLVFSNFKVFTISYMKNTFHKFYCKGNWVYLHFLNLLYFLMCVNFLFCFVFLIGLFIFFLVLCKCTLCISLYMCVASYTANNYLLYMLSWLGLYWLFYLFLRFLNVLMMASEFWVLR